MKWWGWGEEHIVFDHRDKPALAPFVAKAIDINLDDPPAPIIALSDLTLPDAIISPELAKSLEAAVGSEHLRSDVLERIVHAYGKSLRDLVRIRRGDVGRPPDVVVYPGDESEVMAVLEAVIEHDAVVIPFGGGTNIAGSLEPPIGESRTVVSVDLSRLDKVVAIDGDAGLARIQAGALGPNLEKQLDDAGFTIGHFPDSFNHSTLGGWIATRSSGMQSDKYGDISEITRAVRVVTPAGVLATRAVPASSAGPDVTEMVLGSEGRLGIITEATVQVHRRPDERTILGYFFPDWSRGLAAMHEISTSDAAPSVTRLADAYETGFSLATRKEGGSLVDRALSAGMKRFLVSVKHFDLTKMCLSFIGYEGSAEHVKRQKALVAKIVSNHGGLAVGSGPGALYDQKKFDTPYIRDFLLDRGALADVSETAAPWSRLAGMYDAVFAAAGTAFDAIAVRGFIMCHLAHSYHSGACLYFTFAFKPNAGRDPLEQYDAVKSAVEQAFIDNGGTLSHHHAVGIEHAQWLSADISPVGASMIAGLFNSIDPDQHLNPGKIISGVQAPVARSRE